MKSVVLIGMPGAGKSTVGVLLAKQLALQFVDTDLLIQQFAKQTLQQIVDKSGYRFLRELEESVILDHDFSGAVIATGGSAVYGARSMKKLSEQGTVIYLSCGLQELQRRITDYEGRGIAAPVEQSFEELSIERENLYKKFSDIEINTDGMTPQQVSQKVLNQRQLSLSQR